ncbi:hypothetical protein [Tardiphaga sp. 285_C5_N1_2]|uniref:hypothetical protein n=1 Tax=Tardiphaga sp. 285_C5_N1_2 TaxID=3240775 RepID=UPI003F8A0025
MTNDDKPAGRPSRHKDERLSKNRTFRVRDQLDGQLQAAAAASGRSVSEEIEFRLTRSFQEESEFGGMDIRRLGTLLTSSFWFAGERAASANGHADWTPKDWMGDQDCYRTALLKVTMTLIEGMPDQSPNEKALVIEALKGQIATGLVRSGELKFKFEGDE